jgi:hypothetical protein
MPLNIDKGEVMIIKTQNISLTNFVYENNNLKEINSYKYL